MILPMLRPENSLPAHYCFPAMLPNDGGVRGWATLGGQFVYNKPPANAPQPFPGFIEAPPVSPWGALFALALGARWGRSRCFLALVIPNPPPPPLAPLAPGAPGALRAPFG